VSVPRNEAANVDGDEAAVSPILVWNGLVARMRRASGEPENPAQLEVESATRPRDRGEPRRSGEGSKAQACP
jgi:hypothetical protein